MSLIKEKLKNKYIFIILLTIFACVFCLVYLALRGNEPQKYTDVVVEYTSTFLSNKSAEMHLVFILIWGGLIAYFLYSLWRRKSKLKSNLYEEKQAQLDANICIPAIFFAMTIVSYIVNSNTNSTFVFLMLYTVCLVLYNREKLADGIMTYWLMYYVLLALYRIYVVFGGTKVLNYQLINVCAFLGAVSLVVFIKKTEKLAIAAIILQVLISGLWLIYLQNSYIQNDGDGNLIQSYNIKTEKAIVAFATIAILLCLCNIVYIIYKSKLHFDTLEKSISVGTCVSIMAFNQFYGNGVIMSADMRHQYECVIGFQQIFKLGQMPFDEYTPVSGMYSVLHGAFFELFGKGLFANYYMASNVYFAVVVALIVILLAFHIDKKYVFILSICLPIMEYNRELYDRVLFIMPVLLLLSVPKLIEQKDKWLVAWFLTSLFTGLYYPLFGVAVCVGFLPLALVQVMDYYRSGDFKKDLKRPTFYITWGSCLALALLSVPLLWGLAKQILSMANQSIASEGLSRFGQTVNGGFFSYLGEFQVIRIVLYDILSFVAPVFLTWICGFLAIDTFIDKQGSREERIAAYKKGSIIMVGGITLAIAFTSTFMRLDINALFARNAGAIIAVGALIAVFALRYIKDAKLQMLLVVMALCMPVLNGAYGFSEKDTRVKPNYTVPTDYVYTENVPIDNMGTGFFKQETLDTMLAYKDVAESVPKESRMFGFFTQYGPPFLYNVKGFSTIEFRTIRGYKVAQACVDLIKDKKPYIGTAVEPFNNYYLYHWIMTSGYYSYSAEKKMFLPNEEVVDADELAIVNAQAGIQKEVFDVGNHAASLGLSMKSLEKIFDEVPVQIYLDEVDGYQGVFFDREIWGDDADFLYIKLAGLNSEPSYALYNTSKGFQIQEDLKLARPFMRKVYNPNQKLMVGWTVNNQDYFIKCNVSQGELLIPLGAGANWLLNNHDCIWLVGEEMSQKIQIEEIRLLKLREVE